MTPDGVLDSGPVLWMLLGWMLISAAAVALGLLIFFLGRGRVAKKYGIQ